MQPAPAPPMGRHDLAQACSNVSGANELWELPFGVGARSVGVPRVRRISGTYVARSGQRHCAAAVGPSAVGQGRTQAPLSWTGFGATARSRLAGMALTARSKPWRRALRPSCPPWRTQWRPEGLKAVVASSARTCMLETDRSEFKDPGTGILRRGGGSAVGGRCGRAGAGAAGCGGGGPGGAAGGPGAGRGAGGADRARRATGRDDRPGAAGWAG